MIDRYNVWPTMLSFVDRTVKDILRVHHIFQGEVDLDDNLPLQLTFDDDSILFLEGAGDGEALIARTYAWVDPLKGKTDEASTEFINLYGKWSLFDESTLPPFNLLIGHKVQQIFPILSAHKTLSGVQMIINGNYMNFVVVWDECHVLWGKDNPGFQERRVHVYYEN